MRVAAARVKGLEADQPQTLILQGFDAYLLSPLLLGCLGRTSKHFNLFIFLLARGMSGFRV